MCACRMARLARSLRKSRKSAASRICFHLISRIGRASCGIAWDPGVAKLRRGRCAGSLPLDPEAARFYALGVAKLREFDALAAKDLLSRLPKPIPILVGTRHAGAGLGRTRLRAKASRRSQESTGPCHRLAPCPTHSGRGEYYESLGRQEQAASVYHALFELFPDNLDYGLRLVAAQTLSSHGSQALEVIHQLRSLPPPSSDDPRIDLAEKRAMKSNIPAELALVRTAIRKAIRSGTKADLCAGKERGVHDSELRRAS